MASGAWADPTAAPAAGHAHQHDPKFGNAQAQAKPFTQRYDLATGNTFDYTSPTSGYRRTELMTVTFSDTATGQQVTTSGHALIE